LKSQYDVPVGVKIVGTEELAVITKTQADFIVIDGAEGGYLRFSSAHTAG